MATEPKVNEVVAYYEEQIQQDPSQLYREVASLDLLIMLDYIKTQVQVEAQKSGKSH